MSNLPTRGDRPASTPPAALDAAEMRGRVQRIAEVMAAVMQKGVHYGTIPGTPKPTLLKPGSEVLLTTFQIAVEPEIDDLTTGDEIRYRVRAIGRHQPTGTIVGVGIGEASTSEERYRWRNAVCREEFDETPADRRRIKWQKGQQGPYKREQVRTEPADLANTVLKMAKKRAQVDLTLTALGASDIFEQDLEDAPPGTFADRQPEPQQQAPRQQQAAGAGVASSRQRGLIRARLREAGITEAELCTALEIESVDGMPFAKVDRALQWIANPTPPAAPAGESAKQ